jgi:hypothetical protein
VRSLDALWRLLREGGVGRSSWLFALMVLSALTEGFGVLLLVPLLGLLDTAAAPARAHGPARALRDAAQAAASSSSHANGTAPIWSIAWSTGCASVASAR